MNQVSNALVSEDSVCHLCLYNNDSDGDAGGGDNFPHSFIP